MASNYSKLDLKSFKERLGAAHYKNATGARRGVGKSEMSDDEKSKAYKVIDTHFNVEAAPKAAAKTVAKKAVAKKTAPKAAPAAAVKTGRGAGRGKKTAAKKTSTRGRKAADAEGAPATSTEQDDHRNELANLHAGAEATRSAMTGLVQAAGIDGTIDVKAGAREGAALLQRSISRISSILGSRAIVPQLSAAPAIEVDSIDGGEDEDAVEDDQ